MRSAEIGACPDGEIILPAAEIAQQTQLHRAAVAVGHDLAAIIEGLRLKGSETACACTRIQPRIRAVVIDVAAEVVIRVAPVINIPGEQLVGGQKMAGARVQKGNLVFVAVRPGISLFASIQPADRQRLRALQDVVGQHQRDVDIGIFPLPSHFAEYGIEAAGRMLAPAVFVYEIAGNKKVCFLAVRAVFDLRRLPAPGTAR